MAALVLGSVLGLGVACGPEQTATEGPGGPPTSRTPAATPSSSPSQRPTRPTRQRPPCDPGFGFPRPRVGCPDPTPETAWLRMTDDGGFVAEPFRSLANDDEGRTYAESHGLDFPFPNDYYDVSAGQPRPLELGADTLCTGVIVVGYREPLADHVVDCRLFARALRTRTRSLRVGVWRLDGEVVQLSELYRP